MNAPHHAPILSHPAKWTDGTTLIKFYGLKYYVLRNLGYTIENDANSIKCKLRDSIEMFIKNVSLGYSVTHYSRYAEIRKNVLSGTD